MVKSYFEELTKAMNLLANDKKTVFLGQAVKNPGTGMYNTLRDVKSNNNFIELPVSEDFQMGISNGLALAG
jgi:pyruvate/2-oxoglutarate/acetoin dehydrogenase E1 component